MSKKQSNPKVLFFGREACRHTSQLRSLMIESGFDVNYFNSKSRNQALPDAAYEWSGDYIICFRSFFVLPASVIDKATVAAINFHPGPPEYPGSGCVNFALFEYAKNYGVTAHLMSRRVDAGKILECRKFAILDSDNLNSLLHKTHKALYEICCEFILGIHDLGSEYISKKMLSVQSIDWSGPARKIDELNALQKIPVNVSKVELERRIRASHLPNYPLKITLHGYDFHLTYDNTAS